MQSQGEREAELARAVARFYREIFGRGPVETRAFLLDGLAVVVARGVLTAPEARLARSADPADAALVRQARQRLAGLERAGLAAAAGVALGAPVQAALTDLDPATDSAAFVFLPANGRDR